MFPKKNPTAQANGLSRDSANAAATSTPPPVASPIGVSLKRESPLDRGGFKHLWYRAKKERFQQFSENAPLVLHAKSYFVKVLCLD